MEVLSKTREFENWAKEFKYKQVLLHLKKKEANLDVGTVYKKHRHEVCCRMLEILEKFPHLL